MTAPPPTATTPPLWDALVRQLDARADHPALVDPDEGAISYRALVARAEALAGWFAARGIGPGDRVGLALGPSAREVVALLATVRLGAVFVGVFHQWKATQLDHVLRDCDVRVLVAGRRQADALLAHGRPPGLRHLVVSGAGDADPRVIPWPEQLPAAPPPRAQDLPEPPTDPTALRAILYTSGSTGRPKGVMLRDESLTVCARGVVRYLGYTGDDRVLAAMPLCFSYGLSQLTGPLMAGATVVLQRIALPAEVLATVEREHVTVMAGVPTFWHRILDTLEARPLALPALRLVTNAGGAPTQRMLEALPRLLPAVDVVLMYGQSEILRGSYLPAERFADKPGAMGVPVPDVQLWLVDPERGLCGTDEVGEILVRGPMVCDGYWGQPEQTAQLLRPSPHLRELAGDEPVWHTGDLALRDADGVLWFRGRRDTLIKTAGYRISPVEIEDVALASGQVQDAVAFGVPDDALGQAVELAVSPLDGEEIDTRALLSLYRRQLPSYMIPRGIHTLPAPMPRIATGKTDRDAVIRTCRERGAPEPTWRGGTGRCR